MRKTMYTILDQWPFRAMLLFQFSDKIIHTSIAHLDQNLGSDTRFTAFP
jgi:hypothetical protein